MVCLDTTFLIDYLRGNPAAENRLKYFETSFEPITTTPINMAELFEGAYSTRAKKGEIAKVRSILEHLEILDLNAAVCEKYGQLANELRSKGTPIGDLDTLIASAAVYHKQILVTRNKADFQRVPGLVVETW